MRILRVKEVQLLSYGMLVLFADVLLYGMLEEFIVLTLFIWRYLVLGKLHIMYCSLLLLKNWCQYCLSSSWLFCHRFLVDWLTVVQLGLVTSLSVCMPSIFFKI